MKTFEPIFVRDQCGGIQKVYRFANNYGASVVQHSFSYGNEKGLWELGVVIFSDDNSDDYTLTYDTHITSDVLGYLTLGAIDQVLEEIQQLPELK